MNIIVYYTCRFDCGFTIFLLLKVPGFDEILVETINLCCHYYENHMYVMPKEKYVLLKVSDNVCLSLFIVIGTLWEQLFLVV